MALLYAAASPGGRAASRSRASVATSTRAPGRAEHARRAGARRTDGSSRWRSATSGRSSGRSRRRPRRMGRRASATPELPPPPRPLSDRHAVDVWLERRPGPTRRGHARDVRSADEPGPRARARAGAPAPAPALGRHGRRLPRPRQHRADDRVEHPLRPGGREDRRSPLPWPARPDRPRPRRHRAGEDPARRRRRLAPARRQHAGRLDRARRAARTRCARPGPSRSNPIVRLHRRRAPLLHGVPRPVRRLLRRVHPRPAGRRGRRSTRAWSDRRRSRVDVELGRDADGRRDRRPTGAGVWGRPPNVDVAVEADAEEFLRRFVERVGGLAARLATAHT